MDEILEDRTRVLTPQFGHTTIVRRVVPADFAKEDPIAFRKLRCERVTCGAAVRVERFVSSGKPLEVRDVPDGNERFFRAVVVKIPHIVATQALQEDVLRDARDAVRFWSPVLQK
ncbi:hypothetical protein [Paraburkholderia sp. EG304]|uniref:hypothetical protein n=1 Tax=Paraburkholderia sp. EG304 TaxID=3237015 RepID=UPI00397E5441